MHRLVRSLSALGLAVLAGCATTSSAPEQQSTGAYLDDAALTTKVKTRLLQEPGVDSGNINVETYQGVVQLSGFMDSRAEMSKALQAVRSVEGVRSIRNDMRLK